MDLGLELISEPYLQKIAEKVIDIDIDINEIAQTTALELLGKIKAILCDEEIDNFQKLDCIVSVFENYNIDVNGCCDD